MCVELVVVVPKAQILDWIKDVLSTEHGIPSKKVTLASGIPTDLGVDGADAWELIEKTEETWKIKLSFDFLTHFGPESGLFQKEPASPMKVGDLVDLIHEALVNRQSGE